MLQSPPAPMFLNRVVPPPPFTNHPSQNWHWHACECAASNLSLPFCGAHFSLPCHHLVLQAVSMISAALQQPAVEKVLGPRSPS